MAFCYCRPYPYWDIQSEPFDWFSNEQSVDSQIFETQSSLVPHKYENYVKPTNHYHPFAVDSVRREQRSHMPKEGHYQMVQRAPACFTSPTYDTNAKTVAFKPNEAAARPLPLPPTPDRLKSETLTPPDSPKGKGSSERLRHSEREDLEQLMVPSMTQPFLAPYKYGSYAKPVHPSCNVKRGQPPHMSKDGHYQAVQRPSAYVTSTSAKTVAFKPNEVVARTLPLESLKSEILTPPDSPKMEDFSELLRELDFEDMNQLTCINNFNSTMTPFSENSSTNDDAFSEYCGSSSSCVASDSGLEDLAWSPSDVNAKPLTGVGGGNRGGSRASRRRTAKPYAKPCNEERKVRKKEQNKNAATRYRLKKKAESQEIKQEEQLLQAQNDKLKSRLEDVRRDYCCLKSLLRELYLKKGLIK